MRKIYTLAFLLFSFAAVNAQSATTSNDGTSGNVIVGGSVFHYLEAIYLESEVGVGNFLSGSPMTRVEFIVDATSTATFPLTINGYNIYMRNIPSTQVNYTAAGTFSTAGYTLVYSGTLPIPATNTWFGVDLTTPFVRTAGTNLQVLFVRNSGSAQTGVVGRCSIGNSNNVGVQTFISTQRFNGTSALVDGSGSFNSLSAFRPAMKFIRQLATDIEVSSYTSTPPVGCHNTPQSVSVQIKNAGSSTINSGAVSVNLTSTGANSGINLNLSNTSSLASGATQTLTFTGLNLPVAGTTALRTVATLSGDGNAANDTLRVNITTAAVRTTFPINESAENTAALEFGWLRAISGNNGWLIQTGGYRNGNFSPTTTDSLLPQSGTYCYRFDSYNQPSGTRTILHSNCLSFPAAGSGALYDINFWMSHDSSFATAGDSLYLVVSTDRAQTWTRLQGFRRYDPTFLVPGWKVENVNLAAYAGQTIQLGFEGVSKYGNAIGLDNITINASSPLPVTLTSFTGKKEGSNNILSWATANELNNKGFEIMRSADGKNFTSIGFEASKNTTTTSATSYSFVDEKTLAGTNSYQLKQIDKDGKTSLSNIVVLKSATRKLEISTVYPNPANDKLNAVISSDREDKVTVSITDLAGKVVISQQVLTSLGSTNVFFNLQGLTKGTYLVRLTSTKNNETLIQKFVKQ